MTYEIVGRTPYRREVMLTIRAISKPTPEVAEYLLQQKYPSAKVTDILIPAARSYAKPEQGVVDVTRLDSDPIRRRG